MNILTDKFPTKTIIDGVIYELNTDFRSSLNTILAFENDELTDTEKSYIMLKNLYGDNIPPDIEKAVEKAILFLDCGEESKGKEITQNSSRLYSFSKDAKYIYSAIKQTHGIDLETIEYLHWWKFVYLFLDLNSECFFCKMIDLRNKKRRGKLDKNERKLYMQLHDILDLGDKPKYSEEEQQEIDEFMKLIEDDKEATTEKEVE